MSFPLTRCIGVGLWSVLVAQAALPGAASAQTVSRCVTCHQALPEASQGGHGSAAWRRSRHAAAGVQCDACHGGDPAATDRDAAHRRVLRSSDPASPVYYRQIPMTCGRCHSSELGYFRSSAHFARLRSDGRGPNCVTCHGSMATSVLTPESVLQTCSACHAPGGAAAPDKARESAPVLALVRTETILYRVVSEIAGQAPAARSAPARPFLASAGRHLSAAAEVWHSFRLDSATARLAAAQSDILNAWTALGHAAPTQGPAARPRGPERP